MNPIDEYEVLLQSEKRTFAPGDEVWVTVQLKVPKNVKDDHILYGGSVGLVGEERTTLPNGLSGSVSIFDPILVYLEPGSSNTRWRVNLKLPNDIPPSCDLGAVPPCGICLYVLTARIQVAGASGTMPFSGSKRIRVVSTPKMSQMKPADVSGLVIDNLRWNLFCCSSSQNSSSSFSAKKNLDGMYVKQSGDKNTPEFRVLVPNKTSVRCGEHLKYRVSVRGNGPNGRSIGRKFSRIDGLRVWIRRQRWFADGRGTECTQVDSAKQPQIVDFSGSAAGVLPVDFDGSISIPLGIAPTCRGSILSNEYDLVVELLISGRECGTVEIPITVWRDVEGNFLSASFSPNLRAVKLNMESVHETDGTAHYEEDEGGIETKPSSDAMQQLALM